MTTSISAKLSSPNRQFGTYHHPRSSKRDLNLGASKPHFGTPVISNPAMHQRRNLTLQPDFSPHHVLSSRVKEPQIAEANSLFNRTK
uniref:Uncharacterized protein n=1 Tax=Syphacia muris TaxID=451379 RepID=A0A0N5AKB2_9BILA